MGLDTVELILRTEDEFSISIEDSEASHVRTVRDFYNLILSKLDLTPSCLSSKAFYRTRRALTESLGVSRRSIRPTTWLDSLFPESSRIRDWKRVSDHIALNFPKLQHPRSLKRTFMGTSLILAAIPVALVWTGLAEVGLLRGIGVFLFAFPALIPWIFATALANWALMRASPRLAREIPYKTAGDLALGVLAMNYPVFQGDQQQDRPSKELVWKKLVDVICHQLQVDPEEVVPDARFVEDLGVD